MRMEDMEERQRRAGGWRWPRRGVVASARITRNAKKWCPWGEGGRAGVCARVGSGGLELRPQVRALASVGVGGTLPFQNRGVCAA